MRTLLHQRDILIKPGFQKYILKLKMSYIARKRLRADVVQRRFSVSVIYIIHLSGRVFIVYPLTKTLLYSIIIETTI